MNTINFPKPCGLEIITKNGKEITLDEILTKKSQITNIITNSKKHINDEINNDNFIHFAIVYESNFYKSQ